MAKITLPEISNWIKKNANAMTHSFSFSTQEEYNKTKAILTTFVNNHSNYYICNEDQEKLVLVKKNVR